MIEDDYYDKRYYRQDYYPEEIPNTRRFIEILMAIVFIALLILIVSIVIGSTAGNRTETTITNSYNTYNIYNNKVAQPTYSKPYIVDISNKRELIDNRYYYNEDYVRVHSPLSGSECLNSEKRLMNYYDYSQLKTITGVLGNYIDRYEVYVQNREYAGGYFKVIFYFKDYYGRTTSSSSIEYIPAREEKLFLLKDVSPDKYEYRNWKYEVESLSKVPIKNYCNN